MVDTGFGGDWDSVDVGVVGVGGVGREWTGHWATRVRVWKSMEECVGV